MAQTPAVLLLLSCLIAAASSSPARKLKQEVDAATDLMVTAAADDAQPTYEDLAAGAVPQAGAARNTWVCNLPSPPKYLCYPPVNNMIDPNCGKTCTTGCTCPIIAPKPQTGVCSAKGVLTQTSGLDGKTGSQCNIPANAAVAYEPSYIEYCMPNIYQGCNPSGPNDKCGSCFLYEGIYRYRGSQPRCSVTPTATQKTLKTLCPDGSSGYPSYGYTSKPQWDLEDNNRNLLLPARASSVPNLIEKVIRQESGKKFNQRWLMMPTDAMPGIESACDMQNLLAMSNLYRDGWDVATNGWLPPGSDTSNPTKVESSEIAIMANIANQRTQHQLHIHIGRLSTVDVNLPPTKTSWSQVAKDAATKATVGQWTKYTGVVPSSFAGRDTSGKIQYIDDDCNKPLHGVKCEVWIRKVSSLKDAMLNYATFIRTDSSGLISKPGFGGTCDSDSSDNKVNRYSRTLLVTEGASKSSFTLWALVVPDAQSNTKLNDVGIMCGGGTSQCTK